MMGEVVTGNAHDSSTDTGALSPEQAATAGGAADVQSIPEKFRNEDGTLNNEALLASYLELENKQSQEVDASVKDEGEKPSDEGEEGGGQESQGQDTEVVQALEEKGINTEDLTKAYYASGEKLSDEWYSKLEAAGYPRDMVDTYVAGLSARNAEAQAEGQAKFDSVVNVAGGQEGFDQMIEWVNANGSEHTDRYNKAFDATDVDGMKAAVADMYVEYRAKEGADPTRRIGAGDANSGTAGYRSAAERSRAMNDPRYGKDPAYTRDVEQKALAM